MKYYTIEEFITTSVLVRIFKPNGVEEFHSIISMDQIEGYCSCLSDFGYVSKEFLKAEQQARNFRDGLADSFGRY